MTVDHVADMLLCDKETVSERLNKGELPGLKFGRSWVIPATAFFKRLNDLALEEADKRRAESSPKPETYDEVKTKTRGRPRFCG
jgi:excisionase family DNA binding protein